MYAVYSCEALDVMDGIFMLDTDKNISNCMGMIFMEKFEYESMKKYMISTRTKISTLHKHRSKLVKKFGLWWFQVIDDEAWKVKMENNFPLVEGIHNE